MRSRSNFRTQIACILRIVTFDPQILMVLVLILYLNLHNFVLAHKKRIDNHNYIFHGAFETIQVTFRGQIQVLGVFGQYFWVKMGIFGGF